MSTERRAGPSGPAENSESLDRLIDDTAKALTAGSPSAALREGVRARLSSRRRAGLFGLAWWQVPIWQPAMGAAALAVLAVVLMLPGEQAPKSPAARSAVDESPTVAARDSQPTGTKPRIASAGGSAPAVVVVTGPEPAESNQVAVPPDPLPAIEPLDVERVPTIELAVIGPIPDPMPLRIAGLEIERLYVE